MMGAAAVGPRTGGPPSGADVDVLLTDRHEDLDAGLALVHDGFVEAGYMAPFPSGRRLHPSYLNPGTFFALALAGGEAVGAAALIADGPFGLPSDRAFAEENDAIRGATRSPLRECGSLVVRRDRRRHTRGIFTRLMAALVRAQQLEFPEASTVFAVAPESERFHGALFASRREAGPRPLYGAPAVLLHLPGPALTEALARPSTPGRRLLASLVLDPSPEWLGDRRLGRPPPAAWLAPLLDEQGVRRRLEAQAALVGGLGPEYAGSEAPGAARASRRPSRRPIRAA